MAPTHAHFSEVRPLHESAGSWSQRAQKVRGALILKNVGHVSDLPVRGVSHLADQNELLSICLGGQESFAPRIAL